MPQRLSVAGAHSRILKESRRTIQKIKPLTRAIAFTNTIAASKNLVHHWNGVIDSAIERMPEDQRPSDFKCETDHVDGKTNALKRKNRIEWLKGNSDGGVSYPLQCPMSL